MDVTVSTHGDRAVKLTVTHGPLLQSVLLDVADWPTVRDMLQQAVDALGGVDQPASPRPKVPSRSRRNA